MRIYRETVAWTLFLLVLSVTIVAANLHDLLNDPDILSALAVGIFVILFVWCVIDLAARMREWRGSAKPAPKVSQSQTEVQTYQSKKFEALKRTAFDATLLVLRDTGFIIDEADYETGFIGGAEAVRTSFDVWRGDKLQNAKVKAFVEQQTPSASEVRIDIVESSRRKSAWNYNQDVIEETGVRDPRVYQELFDRIGQAIIDRENL